MLNEVFIRIDKEDTGAIKSVRLVVLGEFKYAPYVTRFPYPVRDSVTDNNFINLRVFDKEPFEDENNIRVASSSSLCSGYAEITIQDPAVIIMLRRYRLIHVDLPKEDNIFPIPDDFQRDLNNNPQSGINKGRFKILKLDHGKGGTSGSADP